jgi:AcrR family transcriptional regulator
MKALDAVSTPAPGDDARGAADGTGTGAGVAGAPSLRTTTCAPRRAGRPRDARATQAIADAALRQLFDIGYANMSMESVAAEAGVARATIYRRYQDKADLVTSAIAAAADPPATTGEPLDDLVVFLDYFDAHIAESCLEIVGSILGARTEPSAMAMHRERVVGPRIKTLRAIVTRAKEDGLLNGDADPDLLLEMLIGAVFARRMIGVEAEPGWARRAVEAACAGIATPAGMAHLRRTPRLPAARVRRQIGRQISR